jgi:hypothetical protein
MPASSLMAPGSQSSQQMVNLDYTHSDAPKLTHNLRKSYCHDHLMSIFFHCALCFGHRLTSLSTWELFFSEVQPRS